MTSGDSRGRFSEYAPRLLEESYSLFQKSLGFGDGDNSSSAPENEGVYYSQHPSRQQFGLFPLRSCEPFDAFESNSLNRYGAYESFNRVGTSCDRADGGYQEFDGGFEDSRPAIWMDDGRSCWPMPCPGPSGRVRSPFSGSGRSRYSFRDPSGFPASSTSSYTRLAPIGSRSRGAVTCVQCHYGGKGEDKATSCRGPCRLRAAVTMHSPRSDVAAPVFRGTKRKMKATGPQGKFVKKQRIVIATPQTATAAELDEVRDWGFWGYCCVHYLLLSIAVCVGHIHCDGRSMDRENVEGKVRVKEKRRRRREKNREKYGDKHRMAFTCAFCKFCTFEDKDIEKHFGSTYHRETLDYIRRQTKFDDRVISFLHDCMVQKFRKTVSTLYKLRTLSDQKLHQKLMEGVTEDDYMRKVEVVHCMACDTHIPALFASVQRHLNSPVHLKSKVMYKEQLKRESVLTAKAIINNDSVKVRYEKYMKGEDPFGTDAREDTVSDSSEQERSDEREDDEEEEEEGTD